MKWQCTLLLAFLAAAVTPCPGADTRDVWLSDLDLSQIRQDLGEPHKNRTFDNKPLEIGGKTFERGIGLHAESVLELALSPGARRFKMSVGICDEVGKNGSVEFLVYGDAKVVWSSGVMRGGNPAKEVDLDLNGIKLLLLRVTNGGDGNAYDHAAWADARIVVDADAPADTVRIAPPEPAEILTPAAPPSPRINGAKVFGVRPGAPFLFTIPATGERPMTFSASGLPRGLALDAATGRITGRVDRAGTYKLTLTAKNRLGRDRRDFRIVVGDAIALTPPMGWNSWNCWGCDINEQRVRDVARGFVESGLIQHGWTYVNLDDGWQARKESGQKGPVRKPPGYGLQASELKFRDMKQLCEDVHQMGLKIGLYSSPWKLTYGNYTGGSGNDPEGNIDDKKVVGPYTFEEADAREWAGWGMDYLKYDWAPIDVTNTARMSQALRRSGRDIVFSLSNGASLQQATNWIRLSQLWRTTGDISDTWDSMSRIGFSQEAWAPYSGPGHWNDPDMLVVGSVGWGNPRPSKLTPNEQYTHVSLWCLLSAPLLLGCDLTRLDPFTLNLLTNDEVLAVDQDPLGASATRVTHDADGREVWLKPMEDGTKILGLFNRGLFPVKVAVQWPELGLGKKQALRDLWRQKDLGVFADGYEASIPRHGVLLLQLAPAR